MGTRKAACCVSGCARVDGSLRSLTRGKVKAIAPLAANTDRVDARVLAQLARWDLVPEVWVPSLSDRELQERLRRRAHLVRLRTSARNRLFGAADSMGVAREPQDAPPARVADAVA